MSKAFCCEICDRSDPAWRILRRGDAVVSWACNQHLWKVCDRLQRDHEVTELVVTHAQKAREWAELGAALDRIDAP